MSKKDTINEEIINEILTQYSIEERRVFNNKLVQDLYDVANSHQVARLRTTEEICYALLRYITPIINNPVAYAEATTWYAFSGVKKHIETGEKEFKLLDPLTSMCVSIYFYIYH
jgi:hypothetical protein